MKVTCQSCQAKYSIADEKVRGKIAKIRCKKCGTTIIVNGTVDGATVPVSMAPAGLKSDRPERGAADESWMVLIDDGDQRTLTPMQIVELFREGTVTLETNVWKDGMPEWLPIEQVDDLRSTVLGSTAKALSPSQAPSAPGGKAAASKSNDPKLSAKTPPSAQRAGGTMATTPRPAAAAAPQTAARTEPRKPGRGGSTDLFGSSGGDDALPNQAQAGAGALDKPTGARNENSVLFSLSALTGGSPTGSTSDPARGDTRGSTTGNGVHGSKGKLDDILNLGAGGIYAPSLASPALAPPPVDEPAPALDEPVAARAKPKSSAALFAIGGIGIAVGAGVIAVVLMTFLGPKKDDDKSSALGPTSTTLTTPGAPSANASAAPAAPQAAAPVETAAAPSAPEPPAATPTPTVQVPGAAAAPTPPKTPAGEGAERSRPSTPKPPAGGGETRPTPESRPPPAVAVPPPEKPAPAPAAATGASFDRAAAISALSAIASAVQVCKRADGPTGNGRVAITFASSGNATTANVEGPPFAGTPVGGCVAARFRTAKVPPFGGDPVTVHKSFSIN